jgi:hypothetical protein
MQYGSVVGGVLCADGHLSGAICCLRRGPPF